MIKKISLLLAFNLIGVALLAQGVIDAPYSYLGVGRIENQGLALNRSLSGLGVGISSSYYLNGINPAGLSSMDTMSFTFEVGSSLSVVNFKENGRSERATNGNIDYLAIGFPIAHWWKSSVGFRSFSKVGYNIVQKQMVDDGVNTPYELQRSIKGSGGLNLLYWSNSIEPLKGLSLGFQLGYLFGNKTNRIIDKTTNPNISVSESDQASKLRVNNAHYKLGLQYQYPINETSKFTIGAVFSNQMDLNTEYQLTVLSRSSGHKQDTLLYDENSEYKMSLPLMYGVGVSYSTEKWTFGVDYRTSLWSKVDDKLGFVDSKYIVAGIEYVPNLRIATKFKHTMRYRLSAFYNEQYVQFNGAAVKQFGINIGVGLPVRRSKSTVNLSFDIGKIGTFEKNDLEQTYFGFKLDISMHDIWFMKRRYD